MACRATGACKVGASVALRPGRQTKFTADFRQIVAHFIHITQRE